MAEVFFTDMHAEFGNSLEDKMKRILKHADLESFIGKGELVAIKVHVGERGNLGHMNPSLVRAVVEEVKKFGGKPYLTDTNTLYSGGRHNGVDHAITAVQHGFTYATVGAPFIPADGIRGMDYTEVDINAKHFDKVKLASNILKADKIIFISHFKGHIEAGFGGAIKNMSMGCASIAGKQEQHCDSKPVVKKENCVGCRQCYRACPVSAITMEDGKAVIDYGVCIGCGQCVAACNYGAMDPSFDEDNPVFLEKISEYAYGVHKYFKDKAFYINLANNITPDCDCWPVNDIPIVEDVGFFGSYSPLAIERATMDKVIKSRPNNTSEHASKIKNKENIFQEIRDHIKSDRTLDYCEELGMESDYTLKQLK